jgi:hypothetical protein
MHITEGEAALRKRYGSRILGVSMLAHLTGKEQLRVRIRSRLLPGKAQYRGIPSKGRQRNKKELET